MKSLAQKQRINLVLYGMAAYLLFQLIWWGIQLYQLHEKQVYQLVQNGSLSNTNTLKNKLAMILGEGLVFLILLAIGFWWIRKNVMRDLKFAQKEKNFMQAITHELKTPISAIKINAQTLATRKVNDEQKNNLLSNIIQEANRQELLIENILLSTQFENKVQNNNFEQLNLGAIIDHTIIRFQTLHSNSEVQNNIPKSAEELNIKGIPDLLLIAFYNLVENAHKYSLANSERPKIDLNYRIQNQQICIEISDSGIGIAKEELENIFNKFYRIGDEKNRTTKGSGLGLYIVKSIVDLHYGQIEVFQRKPSGCTFVVKFKKA